MPGGRRCWGGAGGSPERPPGSGEQGEGSRAQGAAAASTAPAGSGPGAVKPSGAPRGLEEPQHGLVGLGVSKRCLNTKHNGEVKPYSQLVSRLNIPSCAVCMDLWSCGVRPVYMTAESTALCDYLRGYREKVHRQQIQSLIRERERHGARLLSHSPCFDWQERI